jgi:hypothetical protein
MNVEDFAGMPYAELLDAERYYRLQAKRSLRLSRKKGPMQHDHARAANRYVRLMLIADAELRRRDSESVQAVHVAEPARPEPLGNMTWAVAIGCGCVGVVLLLVKAGVV